MKVHAPWEVLTRYAEILHFKMPLRVGTAHEQEYEKKPMFFGNGSSPFYKKTSLMATSLFPLSLSFPFLCGAGRGFACICLAGGGGSANSNGRVDWQTPHSADSPPPPL